MTTGLSLPRLAIEPRAQALNLPLPESSSPDWNLRLVIPCFNEAERLPSAEYREFLSRNAEVHLLFVDDGSTDATLRRLRDLGSERPDQVSVLSLPVNRGKAEAVRLGLRSALASHPPIVGFLDADLSTPLDQIEAMLAIIQRRPPVDAVIGIRIPMQGRCILRQRWRRRAGRCLAILGSAILATRLHDTQCGAKLFRNHRAFRACLERPFVSRWLFDIELLARLRAAILSGSEGTRTPELVEYPLETWIEMGMSKVKLRDYLTAPHYLGRIWRDARRSSRRDRRGGLTRGAPARAHP